MTDNKTDSNKVTKYAPKHGISKRSKYNSFIDSIKDAEELADYVINSDTFGTAFEKRVPELDEQGNPKVDEDGNKITKVIKNKADVIAAIVLGAELGIEPMAAITLGKRLDANAYVKVSRGKKLGLDPMTSLDLIHIIPTKNGQTVSTGIHVITGVLYKNGIELDIIEDYEPIDIKYINAKDKTQVKYDIDKHIIINNITKEEFEAELKKGKIPVIEKILNRRTTCVFTRDNHKPLKISYTTQQAIDADLLNGKTSDGREVDGKDNWNKHTATMLRNRTITIGGRIIGSDFLDGMYSNEEASEFTDYEIIETEEERNFKSEEEKSEENYKEENNFKSSVNED